MFFHLKCALLDIHHTSASQRFSFRDSTWNPAEISPAWIKSQQQFCLTASTFSPHTARAYDVCRVFHSTGPIWAANLCGLRCTPVAPACYVLSLALPRTKRWCILCSVLSSTSSVSKNPSMGNESSAFNQHTDPESGTREGFLFLWLVSLLVWECDPSPGFKAHWIHAAAAAAEALPHTRVPWDNMTYWQANVTRSNEWA